MKKKIFKSLSVALIVFSVVFLAFGCIKLARTQEPLPPSSIESGIPGVEIVQPLLINTNQAEYIIFTSIATLGLGIAGLLVSSRIREVSQNNQEEAGQTPITLKQNWPDNPVTTPEQPQQTPHDSYPAAEEQHPPSDNPETEVSQNNEEEAGQTPITPEQNRPDNPLTTPEQPQQ